MRTLGPFKGAASGPWDQSSELPVRVSPQSSTEAGFDVGPPQKEWLVIIHTHPLLSDRFLSEPGGHCKATVSMCHLKMTLGENKSQESGLFPGTHHRLLSRLLSSLSPGALALSQNLLPERRKRIHFPAFPDHNSVLPSNFVLWPAGLAHTQGAAALMSLK